MVTVSQIRAARAYLDWTQTKLAAETGLSIPTIKRIETNDFETTAHGNILKVVAAFEKAGIIFAENGVFFEKPRRQKKGS